MFFKNFKVWETELAGRKLTLETGKMCGLANASILARYGETEVLCNVTASAKPREGVDFFPLSVDYEEKNRLCPLKVVNVKLSYCIVTFFCFFKHFCCRN